MSVVLAVKDGDRIVMGGDCQVSYGGNKATIVSPHLMKVWEVAGHPHTIMGGVGALRDLNIAYANDCYYDSMRDEANKGIDFKFMVNEIVPTIFNLFTDHGRIINENGTIRLNNTSFLFAQGNQCYQIDTDGCITELTFVGESMAIGSGATIAQSAYDVLVDVEGLSIEEKIIRALEEACDKDLHVNYPIYIRDTANPKVATVYNGEDKYTVGGDEDILSNPSSSEKAQG